MTSHSEEILSRTSKFYCTDAGVSLEMRIDKELNKRFYFIHCFVRTRKSDHKVFVQLYEYGDRPDLSAYCDDRDSIAIVEVKDFENFDSLLEKLVSCAEMYILFGGSRRAAFRAEAK
jgi:hypothetical protein